MFSEPHSTKQIEDCVGWAHEIDPATLVDATAGRLGCDGVVCASVEEACSRVRCPVLVAHGDDDRIRTDAVGKRLAELTGGTFVALEGSGHGPHARDPVRVNALDPRLRRVAAPAGAPAGARRGPAPCRGPGGCCTCPPPSASGTPGATSPSPGRCAPTTPTCRSTGWRRTR